MKNRLFAFLFLCIYGQLPYLAVAQSLCSATIGPTSTHGCTYEYFSSISATGTGVTSSISVGGITSCSGYYFPDTAGAFSMTVRAGAGSTVNMNLVRLYNPGYTAYVTVWIDWNNNDLFEATELCGTSTTWPAGSALADSTMTYPFTVPFGTVTGTKLHMRLFLYDNSASAPCTMDYGSAYDFWFIVGCSPPVISVTPTSGARCSSGGTGVSLTGSGAGYDGIYTWAPATGLSATTGASVIASPSATTIYTVTGKDTAGCFSSARSTITVNPPPSGISGTAYVCPGTTSGLSDVSGPGTWSSGNPSVATIDGTGLVTGVAHGTCMITFTLTSTGCTTTIPVTVNPVPSAITVSSNVCPGTTAVLTDSLSGGTWTSGNTVAATVGSGTGIVTGITAGTVIITYTAGTGCVTETTETINPLPVAISGNTNICNGFTTILTDASPGGSWTSSNPAVVAPGFFHGLFIGESAGTAIITYTLSTGCYTTTTFTVNLGPAPIVGSPRICTGYSTTFTDGTSGGAWSSSNIAVATIGTDGVVNGVSAGTTVISYSPGSGCPAIVTVTVFPVPTTIFGAGNVCVSSTVTFTGGVSGGSWSSGNPGIASAGLYTGVITGVSAGTALITYSVAAGCTVTTPIIINPLPAPISGIAHLCPGQSTTLTDDTSGGTWSNGGGPVSVTSGTGNVTAVSAGTSVISYILPTGCHTTLVFTVNPLPATITGMEMVCQGLSVTLTDITGGGTWSVSGPVASVGAGTGIVTGSSAGTVIVTYTLGTGCLTTAAFTVNPLPDPILGTTYVCQGLSVILTDASAGTWSSSGSAVSVVGGTVTGVVSGTALVTFTTPQGCITTTSFTTYPDPQSITGVPNVCIGHTVTLADSTTGGTWSGSGVAATTGSISGNVTGVSVGTVIITYTATNGCFLSRVEIVNPLPGPITGPARVCQYFTMDVADSVSGGTWTSASGAVTIGSSTGQVYGLAPGTAVITYSLGTGCLSATTVAVNPAPDAILGNNNVCIGFTTHLYDSTAGGTWSDAGFAVVAMIGSGTGMVNSVAVGSAIVTYTIPSGCYITETVNVNPIPAPITGTYNVCERATAGLFDATTGGTWMSGSVAKALVDTFSGVVTGIDTGKVTISYTSAAGCLTTTTVNIILSPALITGAAGVCSGLTTTFSDSSSGGTWSSGNVTVATIGSTGIVNGSSTGVAVITYTIYTGCFSTSTVAVDPQPAPITGPAGLCAGDSTILVDTVSGGAWSSGSGTVATVDSNGTVSGVSAGSAVITYSTGPDCEAYVTVTVMPVVASIAGGSSVCTGLSIILFDATHGGTWSSGSPAVAGIDSTGKVTGLTPGTTAITYTVFNACGAGHTIITVNSQPDAGTISGNASVCTGASIHLADAATGGSWSVSSMATGMITSGGLFNGIAPGMDTVFYSVTNICGTAVAKYTVLVNQTPDSVHITTYPPSLLCDNTLFQNFGTAHGQPAGMLYIWSAVNAYVYAISPDGQNCLVNFNESGTSWVILSSGNPGTDCYASDSVSVTVSNLTAPNPSVVYDSPELICNDNTASSYQWGYDDAVSLDSSLIAGAVNESYYLPNPDFANKYYWVMTDHSGCIQKTYYNQPELVAVNGTTDFEMKLFPNPTGSQINVEFPGADPYGKVSISIYNVLGIRVWEGFVSGKAGIIFLGGIPAGVYRMNVFANGNKAGAASFIKISSN